MNEQDSNIELDEEEDLLVSQLNVDISNQYVVFSMGDEEYGIPILSVREIISIPDYKSVPDSPPCIGGIINLRGDIIPLYLLRVRFGLEKMEIGGETIAIIISTGDEGLKTVGLVVDSVSDVLSISDDMISEMPEWGGSVDSRYIEKIGRLGNRMIIVISLSEFFSEKESEALEKTGRVPGRSAE